MALSDCPKCWETPCVCGHDFEGRSDTYIEKQIEMLEGVLRERRHKRQELQRIELSKKQDECSHPDWEYDHFDPHKREDYYKCTHCGVIK